jgi:excisionase family DNA binding protein
VSKDLAADAFSQLFGLPGLIQDLSQKLDEDRTAYEQMIAELRKEIRDLKNESAERLLSKKEAALYCGVRTRTVGRWIKEGKIAVLRIDGIVRVRKGDLKPVRIRDVVNEIKEMA